MNPPALREFVRCVQQLPPGASFNVICFANSTARFREASVPATADNMDAAMAWAREQFHQPQTYSSQSVPDDTAGASRIDLGLAAALREAPQTVLLISDGQPVVRAAGRSLPHAEILARISEATDCATAPVIHAIATRTEGSGFLRRLAAEYGGEYRQAVPDSSLTPRWPDRWSRRLTAMLAENPRR